MFPQALSEFSRSGLYGSLGDLDGLLDRRTLQLQQRGNGDGNYCADDRANDWLLAEQVGLDGGGHVLDQCVHFGSFQIESGLIKTQVFIAS